MDRLKCNLNGLKLANPVTVASGTFGSGKEYKNFYDLKNLGAIFLKGTTLKPRLGNSPQRLVETNGGIINAIGLANPGIDVLIKDILPETKAYGTKIIINISGSSLDEYGILASKSNVDEIDAIEVNVSCPNVKEGGIAFGTDPEMIRKVSLMVKNNTDKKIIMKLSPNVTNIVEMAQGAESGGSHVISLINTLIGMAIDIKKKTPVINNIVGGFSGPPIKPVALRMVYQVYKAVGIPLIGMGGIMNTEDALEFLMAGASAISIGTGNFVDPYIPLNIVKGLEAYAEVEKLDNIGDIVGIAHK